MATPERRLEKKRSGHSYLPYLVTLWGKLNCLYLAMAISLIVWAMVEIGIERRFGNNHSLMITVGLVAFAVSLLSFRINRKARPPEETEPEWDRPNAEPTPDELRHTGDSAPGQAHRAKT